MKNNSPKRIFLLRFIRNLAKSHKMTISTRKQGRGRPRKFPPSRALQVRISPEIYAILARHAASIGKSKTAIVAGLIAELDGGSRRKNA